MKPSTPFSNASSFLLLAYCDLWLCRLSSFTPDEAELRFFFDFATKALGRAVSLAVHDREGSGSISQCVSRGCALASRFVSCDAPSTHGLVELLLNVLGSLSVLLREKVAEGDHEVLVARSPVLAMAEAVGALLTRRGVRERFKDVVVTAEGGSVSIVSRRVPPSVLQSRDRKRLEDVVGAAAERLLCAPCVLCRITAMRVVEMLAFAEDSPGEHAKRHTPL